MYKSGMLFTLFFVLTLSTFSNNNTINSTPLSIYDKKALNNYKTRFSKIKTEEELKQFYFDFNEFKELLSKRIDDSLQKNNFASEEILLKSLKQYEEFIVPTRIVEGTRFYILNNNKGYYNKALKTTGKSDDEYFKILNEIYGYLGESNISIPNWFTQRTCISGSLRLGDSTTLIHYKNLYNGIKTNKIFNQQLQELLQILKDNISSFRSYDHKKEEVINELTLIKNFDPEISENINTTILNIQTNPTQYQFNCNNGECNFE